jgi:hypothetical protein
MKLPDVIEICWILYRRWHIRIDIWIRPPIYAFILCFLCKGQSVCSVWIWHTESWFTGFSLSERCRLVGIRNDHPGDIQNIILKCILNKWALNCFKVTKCYGSVAGFPGHGDKSSGSVRKGNILTSWIIINRFRNILCGEVTNNLVQLNYLF